ncbi:hypothetical protein GA0074692_0028 [Micromonospora pallida]|uniref:Uncharacterized protein n=1 Tax=Micromonospora pallida TaxID=145854 RepID=A0A1C6RHG0_9ACTN|nr:hypothetical protein [Micromonospora pallida]SCL16431.1 hypothetical protein GA0074692_0028 [Micromonospora pallida]
MTTRHLTPGMKRARASAREAIRRAQAHVPPPAPEDDDEALGRQYPYVTPARARAIRHELEETHRAR